MGNHQAEGHCAPIPAPVVSKIGFVLVPNEELWQSKFKTKTTSIYRLLTFNIFITYSISTSINSKKKQRTFNAVAFWQTCTCFFPQKLSRTSTCQFRKVINNQHGLFQRHIHTKDQRKQRRMWFVKNKDLSAVLIASSALALTDTFNVMNFHG